MNGTLATQRRAGELAATIRDHLVHVHVELGAASRHPYVQGKHILMLAGQDLVADLNDQPVTPIVELLAGVIRVGSGFLQYRVGRDHLPWDQILADAEVLEGALSLSAPQFVARDSNFAEAIGLRPKLLRFDFVECFYAHNRLSPSALLRALPPFRRRYPIEHAIAVVRAQPPTTGVFCVETLANADLSIFRCALTNSYGVNANHCASDTSAK